MPHSFDEDEFRAGNGLSCRASAAHVAHAVGESVDHESRDIETPQALGAIAGGYRCHRLTSDADWIVGPMIS